MATLLVTFLITDFLRGKGVWETGWGDQREFQGFRTKLHKPPEERERAAGEGQAAQARTHIYTAAMTHSLRAKFNNSPLERGKEQR